MNLLKLYGFLDAGEKLKLLARVAKELDERVKLTIGHARDTTLDVNNHSVKS